MILSNRNDDDWTYIDITFCELCRLCLDLVANVDQWNLHSVHHQVLLEARVIFKSVLAPLLRCEAVVNLLRLRRILRLFAASTITLVLRLRWCR